MAPLSNQKLPQVSIRDDENAHCCLVTTSDPALAKRISDHFRFRPEGYQYSPLFRRGRWDGYVRLATFRGQGGVLACRLPWGLGDPLKEKFGGKAAVDDRRTMRETRFDDEFIRSLPLRGAGGAPIVPRGYQLETVRELYRRERALAVSPTGSGKSLAIYLLLRLAARQFPGIRSLVVVPTISLVRQMQKDFAAYSAADPSFWCDESVAAVHGRSGEGLDTRKPIVVCTWQTAHARGRRGDPPLLGRFGCLVGDEAHKFKAKSLSEIMEHASGARLRFGLTGTLPQSFAMQYRSMFGEAVRPVTTTQLIEQGTLAGVEIYAVELRHEGLGKDELEALRSTGRGPAEQYQREIEYLISCERRTEFIARLAAGLEGGTLVLFRYVQKHGAPLLAAVKAAVPLSKYPARQTLFVSGGTPAEERERVRQAMREGDGVAVASIGTFSVGIDIPELRNVVFASPSKSQVQVLQSIGRSLRKSSADSRVYDIGDLIIDPERAKSNYAHRHFLERQKIYRRQSLPFRRYPVELRMGG